MLDSDEDPRYNSVEGWLERKIIVYKFNVCLNGLGTEA